MVSQVAKIASDIGFEAIIESGGSSFRVFGWFQGRRFTPDITVQHGAQAVAVVVMQHTVLLYDVYLASQTRRKKDNCAILCVPDAEFRHVPESVQEYAAQMNVRLCPLSEVGDALKELLD